jgi:GNAT superfamily N-acetyltransferase
MSADASTVMVALQAREPLFHRLEHGTTRADFEAMTAEDFWEVGASGARYDRELVWSALQARYAAAEPDDWHADDFACRQLRADTYFVDPAPYLAHEEPDTAPVRPYLDLPRHVSTRPADPVKFLRPTLDLRAQRTCPCGYPGGDSDPRHREAHMQWSTGFPIPKNVPWLGEDIAVVTATSPIRARQLAYACALLPRRENHYDFASFAIGDGTPDDDNTRAYLYRHQDRVIGFVSVYDTDRARWYPFTDDPEPGPADEPGPPSSREAPKSVPRPGDGAPRPAVNVIFTAQIWRRHGVARELVRAISADAGIDLAETAWTTPFSDSGHALARSIGSGGGWLT